MHLFRNLNFWKNIEFEFVGFGIACHLGVLTDIPTVGVAKTLFHVDGIERDSHHADQVRNCMSLIILIIFVLFHKISIPLPRAQRILVVLNPTPLEILV